MMPLIVKKDGRREAYDRIKIINGLKRACEKRPVGPDQIERAMTLAKAVADKPSMIACRTVIGAPLHRMATSNLSGKARATASSQAAAAVIADAPFFQ